MKKLVGCMNCGELFKKRLVDIIRSEKDFCNIRCSREYRRKNSNRKLVKCKQCEREFLKSKKEIKKTKNNFCSRICAAKTNNTLYPKRKPEGECKGCGTAIGSAYTYCKKCYKKINFIDYSKVTIMELEARNGLMSGKHNQIRRNAVRVAKNNGLLKECSLCGKKDDIVTCHIKAIKDFPTSTIVAVVNDPNNLIGLCRNCHWEMDHDKVDINIVKAKIGLRNKQLNML